MKHVWLADQKAKLRVWSDATESWMQLDGWQDLNEVTFSKSKNNDVCLYIPTQLALMLENELSTTQIKQLGQTGQQYLFEELSLMPVEQLQVRSMSVGSSNTFYALNSAQIEQWQQSAELAGYKITALLPDYLLLPVPERQNDNSPDSIDSSVNLYYDRIQNTFLARFSITKGIALSHLSLLPRVLKEVGQITFLSSDDSIVNTLTLDAESDNQSSSSLDKNVDNIPDPIRLICHEFGLVLKPSSLSLKPIDYPLKHPLNFIVAKSTRLASPYLSLAAGLLLLAGLFQIVGDALQWYQYDKAIITTKQATEAQFSKWFPGETLNPRVSVTTQVEPRLVQSQGDSQPHLTILGRISPLLKQSNLIAQSIVWNESNIVIMVKGERREGIDQLQRSLYEQGINANLGAINPISDGGVVGELNISLASEANVSVNENNSKLS